MLGPTSSLVYAQGPGGDAGGSVANVNEDGTDQGGGAAEVDDEDDALTSEQVQGILEDYPAVTFNDSYQGPLLAQTEAEVRLIAEFLTELPEALEALLEAHEAQQGSGLNLAPGGGLDDDGQAARPALIPQPGGGWLVLMNRYASARYRRYRCTQDLIPGFYGFRHKIYAQLGSSASRPVRTRDHSVNFDESPVGPVTVSVLVGFIAPHLGTTLAARLAVAIAAGQIVDALVYVEATEDWRSAEAVSERDVYGYLNHYVGLDAQFDIEFSIGSFSLDWNNRSPRDCFVGPIR